MAKLPMIDKTHDGIELPYTGKARQIGKYHEQGGAARSNNFTSVGSPRHTPVKVAKKGAKGGLPVMPQDIMSAPGKFGKK